ncbi:unnamed protein product [Penicillium bialowiezense]
MPLFEGEQLRTLSGHPVLYKYFPPNEATKSLVVFVPGMAHNARISYGGHEGHRREDFLAYWFNHHGHGFLGISYPLESEQTIMPAISPNFKIPEWGKQTAAIINAVVTEHNLPRKVIVLAWSMGGKILQPITVQTKQHGIEVELFVSLAATPALPGILPAVSKAQFDKTPAGYATKKSLEKSFLRQLEEQCHLRENCPNDFPAYIIDPAIYKKDYLGATPIGLTTSGFQYDVDAGDFIEETNKWQIIEDGKAHEFSSLPPMAAIYPTSPLDFRHALTDKATWSFLMTQRTVSQLTQEGKIGHHHQLAENASASAFASGRHHFRQMQEVVFKIPELMTVAIDGNHFFFVGEIGAQKTVEGVIKLLENKRDIEVAIDWLRE